LGLFFHKPHQEDTASPTEPATTSTSATPLSVEEVKAEAEALSYMLKMFFSGWGHMPEPEGHEHLHRQQRALCPCNPRRIR
jgi:hypothetical protein